MGNDEAKRKEALNCLQADCGIQVLLPRFAIAIAEGVRTNVVQPNLPLLIYLLRMVLALLQNPTVTLERNLHELVPAILSCTISRKLSNLPSENHWELRKFATKLLVNITNVYKSPSLRARIISALASVFTNPSRSMVTIYGASFALNEFGVDTVRAVLVPRLENTLQAADRIINEGIPEAEVAAAQKLKTLADEVMRRQ